MKTKLTLQELKALSVLLKQDEVILQQLNENGVLDSTKSRAHLIKEEYRQLSDEPKPGATHIKFVGLGFIHNFRVHVLKTLVSVGG